MGTLGHWNVLALTSPRSALNRVSSGCEFSKWRKLKGGIHFFATGIVRGNDNDIVRTIGVIPVKGRGLALGPKRGQVSAWEEWLEKTFTWVSTGVLTVKSAATRRTARAKTRVVVKRVEYIVEIIFGR